MAGAGVGLVLVLSASGCGAAEVEAVARDRALEILQAEFDEVLTCLGRMSRNLRPHISGDDLPNVLMSCGDTTFVGRQQELGPDDEPVDGRDLRRRDTVFFGASLGEDGLTVQAMTTATAQAQAGVANARVNLATCWRSVMDLETGTPNVDEIACPPALLTVYNPLEPVALPSLERPSSLDEP